MISLSASGGSVVFTFANSTYYLYGDGTITVPVNSLSLVIDNSNIATFKKAATNDIFVAAPVAEFGMSKAELEAFYKENMVGSTGGGDITSGEVQTMIDESISGKADTSAVTAVNDVLTAHTANTTIHVTAGDKLTWDGKQDALTAGAGIDITNDVISCTVTGGGNNVVELTQAQYDALVDKDPDAFYIITDAPAIDLSGYAQTSAVTAVNDVLTAHTANTTIHVTAGDKLTWDGKSDFSGSYNDLTDKPTIPTVPTSNTAFTNDAGYVTSGYVDSAVSGKQDTLSAGTGIEISGNVISATGGGSTYSAGRNISIDTGNTISCTLNLTNGGGTDSLKMKNTTNASGSNSFSVGSDGVRAQGISSFAGGSYSESNGYFSFAFGRYAMSNNYGEASFGYFNAPKGNSSSAGQSSGNTLFSVGNGTGNNSKHNAFEIRQNGDIYISKDGQDVKLQDQLGGGGSTYTAGDGINIENDVISTSYTGYTVFDSGTTTPEMNLTNFEGQCLILCPIDCEGSTQGAANFDVGGHNYNFTFYPETQAFSDNGDGSWMGYFTLEWDNAYGAFKLTTNENQPIDAHDEGCVRFLTEEIRYSGTTTDGINGALEVATKVDKQLGGLKFVRLTQEEYDALTTKDSDTLYIIVPTFGGLTVYYIIDALVAQNEVTLFNGGGESSGESSGGGGALPSTMIVDGVEETPVNTWRFEEGTHIVQYVFEDNTIPQMFLNNIDYAPEIEIGDDITTIADSFAGDGVFAGMPALQKATIGKNVTTIGDYAFNTSSNLSTDGIYVKATTPPTLGGSAFDNTGDCPIYVPASAVETYKAATGWSDYASRIQAIV